MASVTLKGNPVNLAGNLPKAGDPSPAFTVVANDLSPRTLADYRGKVVVLCAVPSLGHPHLRHGPAASTRRRPAGRRRAGLVVSMDLPFAQARWCGAAGVTQVQTLSDHRDASFGNNWGVLIKSLRLLARAVFVMGRDGRVGYVQLVPVVFLRTGLRRGC
jgi:thiol peroxidase